MSINRRVIRIASIALLTVCAYTLVAWIFFLYSPIVTTDKGVKYRVNPGASLHSVIADLDNQDIITHPFFFSLLARMHGNSNALKAGVYLFPRGITPSKLLDQIQTGSGILYHVVTIIPGTNFAALRLELQKDPEIKQTLQGVSDGEVMARLGHPELQPEGEFFPDTYYFVEGTSDLTVLKRAFNLMQTKLNAAWDARDVTIPFKTPYEALIGASIIEKEAYYSSELPVIAGVMVNRLNKGMRLQFDPTVIYGLQGHYVGMIRKVDLTTNTPYNTYVHKGLPPTPISLPGLDAIQAIMHPEHHDYYYFVARGDGSHQFSKSWAEHDKAVKSVHVAMPPMFFNTSLIKFRMRQMVLQDLQASLA